MPVHPAGGGYRWGKHGKVYRGKGARAKAAAQGRAAYANGYRGDAADAHRRRTAARQWTANRLAEARYVRDLKGILGQVHAGFMAVLAPHVEAKARATRHDTLSDHGIDLGQVEARMVDYIRKETGPAFDRMAHAVNKTNEATAQRVIGIPLARTSPAATIAHARDTNIRLVERAGRAYADQVREVFDDPENFGLRVEELTAKLAERGDVSLSRAELIARDQTLKLNSAITKDRQTSAGVTRYTWSGSLDERERPAHRALEGQEFGWNDPPVTDDEGNRNHPGEDFQCRCVAVPVVDELEGI